MSCLCRNCRKPRRCRFRFQRKQTRGSRLSARHMAMMSAKIRFFHVYTLSFQILCVLRPPRRQRKRALALLRLKNFPARSCQPQSRLRFPSNGCAGHQHSPCSRIYFTTNHNVRQPFRRNFPINIMSIFHTFFVTICNFWKIFPFIKIKAHRLFQEFPSTSFPIPARRKNAPGRQTAEGAVSLFLCQAANGIDCSLYQL